MQACYWQPDARLQWIHLILLVLALLALAGSTLAGVWKTLLLVVYASVAGLLYWRVIGSAQVVRGFGLRFGAQGWQLWTSKAGWQRIDVLPQSIVLPWLVIVYYRCAGPTLCGARALVISERAVGVAAHRALRVQVRFASPSS